MNKLNEKIEFVKHIIGDGNKHINNYIEWIEFRVSVGKKIREELVNDNLDILVLKGLLYHDSEMFSYLTKYQIEKILDLFPVDDFQRELLTKRKIYFDIVDILKNMVNYDN